MVILSSIRVIVRGFLCIVRGFLRHLSKKFYVHVLAQCAVTSTTVNNTQYHYHTINNTQYQYHNHNKQL